MDACFTPSIKTIMDVTDAGVRDSVNAVVAASPVNTSVTKFVDCKGFPIYAIVVYLFALID
jgi:hypothetical protein